MIERLRPKHVADIIADERIKLNAWSGHVVACSKCHYRGEDGWKHASQRLDQCASGTEIMDAWLDSGLF